ncbi:MAG: hypothetical protein ACPGQ5_07430 [Alphaproteobacteria bacterium]
MSDATLQLEETPAPDASVRTGLEEVIFAGRYRIQPGVVLPHLATSSSRAYLTIDSEKPDRELYALVLDHQVPARLTAILAAKDIPHDALLKPIR